MNELERIPERKKLSHYLLGNARTIIMALILFTVMLVMTTNIRLVTVSDITELGLEFFIILFASYCFYILCADGSRAKGYATDIYKEAVARFNDHKKVIEESMLTRMGEFCNYYIDEELRKTRMQYLSVVCIPYDVYMEKYVKLGKREIDSLTELTKSQKKAIKKANRVKRINLTPERIMTQGETVHTRYSLALTPETMRNITYGLKIVKMSFVSLCMSLIALDIIIEPSWTVFAEAMLKIATVIINGFEGNRAGFNNITVHTVNYLNSQSALMRQAIYFADNNPS